MKDQIAKYLSLAGIVATVAWFFWNPTGWSFEWEPIVVFLTSLGAFIAFDRREYSHSQHGTSDKVVNPSDVSLFEKALELLPSTTVVHFLKKHDFWRPFQRSEIKPISQFVYEWNNAEHEFQDERLEILKAELYEAASKFDRLIGIYTSPNKDGFQAVRPDSYEDGGDLESKYRREAKELGDAADEVVESHQKFVREGKQILGGKAV
ncbi:hypothetical protein NUW46_02155 [Marinobacter sp. MA]|uniref:hypothetical protein n=1 Tax=Marinobacter sp. MA TaxID=2971606 RepID=UPI003AAF5FEC